MQIIVSGQTQKSFTDNLAAMIAYLQQTGEAPEAISYTNQVHKDIHLFRQAFCATSIADLLGQMESFRAVPTTAANALDVAFIVPGTGSAFPGAGQELYHQCGPFRKHFDEVAAIAREVGAPDPATHLYGDGRHLIYETPVQTMAALALSYAYCRLLQSLGIHPTCVYGHSLGEIIALACTETVPLADLVRILHKRSMLVEECERGLMVAVRSPVGAVTIPENLALCVINNEQNHVVGGPVAAVEEFASQLEKAGTKVTKLKNCHAFHSSMLSKAAHELGRYTQSFTIRPSAMAMTTSMLIDRNLTCGPEWFSKHLTETFDFTPVARALFSRKHQVVFEVGAGTGLTSILGSTKGPWASRPHFLPLCTKDDAGWLSIDRALSLFINLGGKPNFQPLWTAAESSRYRGRRVALPRYVASEVYSYCDPLDDEYGTAAVVPATDSSREDNMEKLLDLRGADAFLLDHRIRGEAILPGMYVVELSLRASRALGWPSCEIRELTLIRRVALTGSTLRLKTRAQQIHDGLYQLTFHVEYSMGETFEFAVSRISASVSLPPQRQFDVRELQKLTVHARQLNQADIYQETASKGLQYGPAFQGAYASFVGEDTILTHVRGQIRPGFICDPCRLDASSQVRFPDLDGTFLPHSIASATFFAPLPASFYCLTRRGPTSERDVYRSDQIFVDSKGLELGRFVGFVRHRLPGLAIPGFEVQYSPIHVPVDHNAAVPQKKLSIVVYGPAEPGFGSNLPLLVPGEDIVITRSENFPTSSPAGSLCFWFTEDPGKSLFSDNRDSLVALVAMLQHCARVGMLPDKIIIDRQFNSFAHPRGASALVGAIRSYYSENSAFQADIIHLGGLAEESITQAADLIKTLMRTPAERRELYHCGRGQFRTPQVQPLSAPRQEEGREELVVDSKGSLDGLRKQTQPRRQLLLDHELEIETTYSALNFKDVLYIMGRISKDDGSIPICLEAVGQVVRIGAAVRKDLLGSTVVFFPTESTHSSHYVMNDEAVLPVSAYGLSAERACSLPISLTTAYYGLIRLAQLKPGESILIHSAMGGLGQMALILARVLGCRIYATAHPDKHEHLKKLGLCGVYSSRSGEFKELLLKDNPGGVHVVLNSLKDHITESIDCLAQNGRLVEVGKIGIWTAEKVAERRPDVHYHDFILNENVPQSNLSILKDALEQFGSVLAQTDLLHINKFPADDFKRAYRLLASGHSRGKILLEHTSRSSTESKAMAAFKGPFKDNGSYVIIGGTGALGRAYLRYLMRLGTKHLVLVGRRPLDAGIMKSLEEGSSSGGFVTYETCDVSDQAAVDELAKKLKTYYPKVRGIVFAAGDLADSLLEGAKTATIDTVLLPKIKGIENLLKHFDPEDLDFLHLVSSVASVLGSASQGVYAAANSVLDALAHSLPHTMTVNWGPWSGSGMAESISSAARKRKIRLGIRYMSEDDAMNSLKHWSRQPIRNLFLCPVEWERFLQVYRNIPKIFEKVK